MRTWGEAPGEGQDQATGQGEAKPKQLRPDKAPTITLGHLWGDKQPDWLYRCTLVTRYEVRPDGTVWRTLEQVLSPDGTVVEDFWRLPLDFRLVWALLGDLGVCESGDVGGVELLEFNGGAPAQGAVASLPVVEDLQVLKDRVGQLDASAPSPAVQ